MGAYLDAPALVPRTNEQGPDEADRTRFTVVATAYPAGGAGQCSECPSDGQINQAVGEVSYVSTLFRGPITEATCLPCLPGLLAILSRLDEGPLTVALYSPCVGVDTPQVRELDDRRAELIGLLVSTSEDCTYVRRVLAQRYTALQAELRRIAGVA